MENRLLPAGGGGIEARPGPALPALAGRRRGPTPAGRHLFSRPPRPLRRRRHDSGAARDGRRPLRRGPASSASSAGMDKAVMKVLFQSKGLLVVALAGGARFRMAGRPARHPVRPAPGLSPPRIRQTRQPGLERRHLQGQVRRRDAGRLSIWPSGTTAKSSSNAASADAKSNAASWATTRPRPPSRAKSSPTTNSTTTKTSTRTAGRASASRPICPPPSSGRSRPRPSPLSRPAKPKGWPGSTSFSKAGPGTCM